MDNLARLGKMTYNEALELIVKIMIDNNENNYFFMIDDIKEIVASPYMLPLDKMVAIRGHVQFINEFASSDEILAHEDIEELAWYLHKE